MRLFEDVYLVGSGQAGLSHDCDCHVYLLDGGEEMALIDAGVGLDTEAILRNVEEDGLDKARLNKVLITHCHSDHAAGAKELRERFGLRVIASEIEAEFMRERNDTIETGLELARNEGIYPEDYEYSYTAVDEVLEDGDTVRVGKYGLRVIIVPGHSTGATCYLLEQTGRRTLFTGDVVFFNGNIGLLNCPGSGLDDYRENIGKLAGLGIDALLSGHFLFTVRGGQTHIDQAIENLKKAFVPPSFG